MPDAPVTPLTKLDPVEAWKPWAPDADRPWDLKWAGHLFRRAAFGATWQELQDAVGEGPEETLNRLLAGREGQADFNRAMDDLAPTMVRYRPDNESEELQGWWLYRMMSTPHPLLERMTLFWHNHFATSIAKVRQVPLMKEQNLLLRKHALGKFRPFVLEMSKDPAMLVWLDSNSNVRGRPNENYARELMELFTLGVGNYTEKDVREAARAFTGWHTTARYNPRNQQQDAAFTFNAGQHDGGPKTVLGQTGNWDGGDVVRILLEQPACARFLARKLYRHFISEAETPPDGLLEPLAEQLRKSDYDLGGLVRTILRSRHFYSDYAYRQRIKGPVEFLIGTVRTLEGSMPLESAIQNLPGPMDGLGQTLFAPPNVKGWDGGKAWLNSATVLARHNLAWRFVQGPNGPLGARVNPAALVQKHAGKEDYAKQVDFLLQLLLQTAKDEVEESARQRLVEFTAKGSPKGGALQRRLRETAHAILLMPEYQLA
jgi:uncharacterized protein (DUF1800 family)